MPSRNGITCPMVTIQLPEGNARAMLVPGRDGTFVRGVAYSIGCRFEFPGALSAEWMCPLSLRKTDWTRAFGYRHNPLLPVARPKSLSLIAHLSTLPR